MTRAPIRHWCEPIDNLFVAVHARVRFAKRGHIYGFTTYRIVERGNFLPAWKAQEIAEAALRHDLQTLYDGLMPYMCRLDEAERLGVG
jgi:hypothetical protein